MCDYSLHSVKTRPAKVGDKPMTRVFNFSTRGFCAPEDVTRSSLCTSRDRVVLRSRSSIASAVGCSLARQSHKSQDGNLSGKSIKIGGTPITMPWSFRMAKSCC